MGNRNLAERGHGWRWRALVRNPAPVRKLSERGGGKVGEMASEDGTQAVRAGLGWAGLGWAGAGSSSLLVSTDLPPPRHSGRGV